MTRAARLLAAHSFGQRAGDAFEFLEIVTGEKICVREPPPLQAALEQRDGLLLGWKIRKRHGAIRLRHAGFGEVKLSQRAALSTLNQTSPPYHPPP